MPSPTQTAELSSGLRLSVLRLARRLRVQRADLSLSLNQLATLATLSRHGSLTPGELAQHERVQPPSMTRMLAALEARELVTRAAHPSDGRQQLVTLTATAEKMLHDDRQRRDAWLAQRLAELTAQEREVLRAAAPVIERLSRL